jgi:hypothetical protein
LFLNPIIPYPSQNQFGINFPTQQDKQEAFEILNELWNEIQMNNQLAANGSRNFVETWYPFSRFNDSYFAAHFLGVVPQVNVKASEFHRVKRQVADSTAKCLNLPSSKNWADEGKLSPVQNQGECACSYLFSSVGAIESYVAIQNQQSPAQLSRQNALECVKEISDINLIGSGCSSGRPEWIWKYSREMQGLIAENTYNKAYTGDSSGACVSDLARESNSEIDHWVQIPAGDEEAMKCHVANVGPLVIEMTVGFTSFNSYKSGIWDDPDNDCQQRDADHGMILVGFGTEVNSQGISTDYWVVQNSWGDAWADRGFVKVRRGKNLCQIASRAMYPVIKTIPPQPLPSIKPPKSCEFTKDLYDQSGVYKKSLCFDLYNVIYDHAQDWCFQNGMKLYQSDFSEQDKSLLNIAEEKYAGFEAEFYIEGKYTSGCMRIKNTDDSGTLTTFHAKPGDCSTIQRSVCEFLNENRKLELI